MAWQTSGEACVTGYGAVWIRAFWTRADAGLLDHAAELVRTVEHVARLVVGRAGKWLPATEHGRKVTEKLTGQILEREFPDGLESELDRTFGKVRAIYERVLGSKRQVCVAPASCRLSRGRLALGGFTTLQPKISDAANKRGRVARDHTANQFRRRV